MKPASLLAQPLSEAEIEALDHFLGSDSTPEEAMDVSMMDGCITAIASGPNLMMPSDLLRWIWDPDAGAASPAFASANESQRIIALILRHWNDVNDRLNHAPEQYEPLVMERESNGSMVSVIDEWCVGYFKGIETDRAAWAPLLAEHPDWFTVIFLYGTEDGWKELERRQDTHEQHQAFANSLGESARHIHHYWLAQRKAQIARGEMPGSSAAANRCAAHRRSGATIPARAAPARNTNAATAQPRTMRVSHPKMHQPSARQRSTPQQPLRRLPCTRR